MTYEQKKEIIFQNYERSWDLNIAMTLVDLTNGEKIKILNDEELKNRIIIHDANIQENLISNLKGFSESDNEGIAIKATLELGKMFYKKRFVQEEVNNDEIIESIPDKIILIGK